MGQLEITTQPIADERVNLFPLLIPVAELLVREDGTAADTSLLAKDIVHEVAANTWSEVGGAGSIVAYPEIPWLQVRNSFQVLCEVHDYLLQKRQARLAQSGKEEETVSAAAVPSKVVSPLDRRIEIERLADQLVKAGRDDRLREQVRGQLLDFRRAHPGAPEALRADELAASLAWPADRLSRDQIRPEELAAAGDGDPGQAPEGLVAILARRCAEHWGAVRALAFRPDKTMVASAGDDGILKLWDANCRPLRTLLKQDVRVSALDFSPDGKTLASAMEDGSILMFDADNGTQLRRNVWDRGSRASPQVQPGTSPCWRQAAAIFRSTCTMRRREHQVNCSAGTTVLSPLSASVRTAQI